MFTNRKANKITGANSRPASPFQRCGFIVRPFCAIYMKLIERAKKHPVVAYVLGIIPPLGLVIGISNWYLARTTEHYEALLAAKGTEMQTLLAAKDTEMQRIQNHVIEARTELKEGVSVGRPHSDPPPPRSSPFSSLDTFSVRLRALDDRFAEQEQFVKSAAGQRVTWSGSVVSVFTILNEQQPVALMIQSTNQNIISGSAGVIFPSSFRDRLFALRRGDLVTISGTIRSAIGAIQIDADTITLNQ
jgi:hypothetical protein